MPIPRQIRPLATAGNSPLSSIDLGLSDRETGRLGDTISDLGFAVAQKISRENEIQAREREQAQKEIEQAEYHTQYNQIVTGWYDTQNKIDADITNERDYSKHQAIADKRVQEYADSLPDKYNNKRAINDGGLYIERNKTILRGQIQNNTQKIIASNAETVFNLTSKNIYDNVMYSVENGNAEQAHNGVVDMAAAYGFKIVPSDQEPRDRSKIVDYKDYNGRIFKFEPIEGFNSPVFDNETIQREAFKGWLNKINDGAGKVIEQQNKEQLRKEEIDFRNNLDELTSKLEKTDDLKSFGTLVNAGVNKGLLTQPEGKTYKNNARKFVDDKLEIEAVNNIINAHNRKQLDIDYKKAVDNKTLTQEKADQLRTDWIWNKGSEYAARLAKSGMTKEEFSALLDTDENFKNLPRAGNKSLESISNDFVHWKEFYKNQATNTVKTNIVAFSDGKLSDKDLNNIILNSSLSGENKAKWIQAAKDEQVKGAPITTDYVKANELLDKVLDAATGIIEKQDADDVVFEARFIDRKINALTFKTITDTQNRNYTPSVATALRLASDYGKQIIGNNQRLWTYNNALMLWVNSQDANSLTSAQIRVKAVELADTFTGRNIYGAFETPNIYKRPQKPIEPMLTADKELTEDVIAALREEAGGNEELAMKIARDRGYKW